MSVPDARESSDAATEQLVALATGAWRQAALAVAARLGLCPMLGARAADLEEVCYSLGTQRLPTRYFLAACAGLGLVEERDEAYRLGPVGRAVLATGGAELAAWAGAGGVANRGTGGGASRIADVATSASAGGIADLADVLAAVLAEPLLVAPGTASRKAPTSAPWDDAALVGLHAPAAAALAAAMLGDTAPPAEEGLALEIGGHGIFVRALLARAAGWRGVLVLDGQAGAAADHPTRAGTCEAACGEDPPGGRLAILPDLAALAAQRAAVAVVAQAVDAGGAAALRGRLGALRPYLAPGARLAVVGPFLAPAQPRPLAPLLALLALAAGRSAWCLTLDVVAAQLQASGYAPVGTLVLPEPDVALLAEA